jgi:hypothetical protein
MQKIWIIGLCFDSRLHWQLEMKNKFTNRCFRLHIYLPTNKTCGPDSSVGIATDYGLDGPEIESRWGARFSARPDRPRGRPRLLYNGYRVFPGGKVRPGRSADHSPSSSAEVLEEQSSTPLWAPTGPVMGLLYFTLPLQIKR